LLKCTHNALIPLCIVCSWGSVDLHMVPQVYSLKVYKLNSREYI
jgi:hypothetical protein